MKNKQVFISFLLVLSSCSSPNRRPSSFFENVEIQKELLVFSGPGAPTNQIIASSLPNLPLNVEIVTKNPDIHCMKEGSREEALNFQLKPANMNQEKVVCELTHNDSEYPSSEGLKVNYSFDLDKLELPNDLRDYKNVLNGYLKTINDGTNWSPDLKAMANSLTSEQTMNFIPNEKPSLISSISTPLYFDLLRFDNALIIKKKPADLGGVDIGRKASKLIYPEYHHGALVCGTGVTQDKISKIISVGGEIFSLMRGTDPVYCQLNHYQEKQKIKLEGVLQVTYKQINHETLSSKIQGFIQNEERLIQQKILAIYQTEKNHFNNMFSVIEKNGKNSQASMKVTVDNINRDKFLAKKTQIITNLFPAYLKDNIGKVASRIYVTPLRKKVFQANGTMIEQLYIVLQNSVLYRLESNVLQEKLFEQPTSKINGMNIALQTSDKWNKELKSSTFSICYNQMEKMAQAITKIQVQGILSYDKTLDHLKEVNTNGDQHCPIDATTKESINLSKGNDYYIHWQKQDESSNPEIYKAKAVSSSYKGKVFDVDHTFILERDQKYSHPAFASGVVKKVDKGLWEKFFDKIKGVYIIPYDEDLFITLE